ncbi:MAG: hypothetical protein R2789_04960 [Microthrixaceae bacterium]
MRQAGQQLVFTGSVSFDGVDVEPLNDTVGVCFGHLIGGAL